MIIDYDPIKNQRNIDERNLPFDKVADLDWDSALIGIDDRKDYGETRTTLSQVLLMGDCILLFLLVSLGAFVSSVFVKPIKER